MMICMSDLRPSFLHWFCCMGVWCFSKASLGCYSAIDFRKWQFLASVDRRSCSRDIPRSLLIASLLTHSGGWDH